MFRRWFYVGILAFALVMLPVSGASASSEANISCTVTYAVPVISVSVTYPFGNPDFGTVHALETPWWERSAGVPAYVSIQNDGDVATDLFVRGGNAYSQTTTSTWTLRDNVGVMGTDEYRVGVYEYVEGGPSGEYTFVGGSNQLWPAEAVGGSGMAVDATKLMAMRLWAPGAVTQPGAYTFNVVLTAVQH